MRRPIVGVDWGDLGKNAFGGVHSAGKVLASAFGAGAVVAPVEQLESGALPDWAKSAPAAAKPGAIALPKLPPNASPTRRSPPPPVAPTRLSVFRRHPVASTAAAAAIVGGLYLLLRRRK